MKKNRVWSTQEGLPSRLALENLPKHKRGNGSDRFWSQQLPRTPLSNLAYSSRHRLIIFGTEQRTLDAVSSENGGMVFSLQLKEPIVCEPLIHDDRVYVGEGLHDARRASVVAIQLPEGKPIWQHEFQGHIESAPRMMSDKKKLIGCAGEAGVYSLNREDGALNWQNPIGHCDTTPLILDGAVYGVAQLESKKSILFALSAQSGELKWSVQLPGDPWGTVMHDPLTNYLVVTTGIGQISAKKEDNERGWLHAIDPIGKSRAWSKSLEGMPLMEGILFNDRKYSISIHALKNGEISAFDVASGSSKWSLKLSSPILSNPRLLSGGDRIVAFAFDGGLYDISLADGKILSRRTLGTQSLSAPVFGDDQLFLADRAQLWVITKDFFSTQPGSTGHHE